MSKTIQIDQKHAFHSNDKTAATTTKESRSLSQHNGNVLIVTGKIHRGKM